MDLAGRTGIVTGSSSGIGRAIALALAQGGAAVAVNYARDAEGAQSTVKEIEEGGGRAFAHGADVSKPADVQNLIGETVRRFGRLDIMVNNAGVEYKMPFLETPLETWERVISVNLTGPWLGCQEAAKQMVSQGGPGRIINVSSVHEDLAMPTNAPYCAAKGGLRMLTRTIAVELAPHNITVNNVAPGAIETPMDAGLEQDPAQMNTLLSEIPLGRMGRPEEVASLAVYLASDTAAYITGSTLFVDGGMIRQAGSL
ncbi:MAG TPA: SDR family oxidoreductase [Rubrobacteraceae bacterium]|nr:SDR family oxidoreductase [Rubrobacteraceae bacterium]